MQEKSAFLNKQLSWASACGNEIATNHLYALVVMVY